MKLEDLTKEQKDKLFAEMKANEAKKEKAKQEERKTLKELASKEVETMFKELTQTSSMLSKSKTIVFGAFESLIEMKAELYKVKSNQQTHTFSNKTNDKRIKLGFRVNDRYDDTAEVGIAKVKEYINSLAKDKETANLVNMVNNLLQRNKKGDLNASRVIDLSNLAKESGNADFIDGVDIIMKAHTPEKSSYFIEAEYKDEHNKWHNVPLSISSAMFTTDK